MTLRLDLVPLHWLRNGIDCAMCVPCIESFDVCILHLMEINAMEINGMTGRIDELNGDVFYC